MSGRNRTRTKHYALSGRVAQWDAYLKQEYSIYHDSPLTLTSEEMNDHVNPGPPFTAEKPMDKWKYNQVQLPKASFRKPENYWHKRWISHAYQRTPKAPPRPIIPWQVYTNKMLANINPNNPDVDIPVALRELFEFPRMVRDVGRLLQKRRPDVEDLPGGHIAYQFGWAPLVSDLSKLLNLAETLANQTERLDKAGKRKSMRFTVANESYTWTTTDSSWYGPDLTNGIRPQCHYSVNRRVWATLRVVPDFTAPYWNMDPLQRAKQALGLYNASGSGPSASTLWNMIPWTWLIDYFISVGSYLEATRGVLPFAVQSYCIMVHDVGTTKRTVGEKSIDSNTSFSHEDGYTEIDWKSRMTGTFPKARVSFDPNPMVRNFATLASLSTVIALRSAGR